MPLQVLPIHRRTFLTAGSFGIAAGLIGSRIGFASTVERLDLHNEKDVWFAVLSDTHVAGDPSTVAHDVNMFEQLETIVAEVLAEPSLPTGVIINGDCAYLTGKPDDYAQLAKALQPLFEAGLPVTMAMGNHDDRVPFRSAFEKLATPCEVIDGKEVTLIESALESVPNIFVLDSLKEVDLVTGEIGKIQREWLKEALTGRSDRPAVVFAHHNPQTLPEGSTDRVTGLADTAELMEVLHSQPHVVAYVFGHTHNWSSAQSDNGLHLINLPPCAYVFDKSRPSGWVRMKFKPEGVTFELVSLDKSHSDHSQVFEASLEKLPA